jgi:mono/diheme cytochrome c family protein
MANPAPATVTAVEAALGRRRRWLLPVVFLIGLICVVGGVLLVSGIVLVIKYSGESTPHYADAAEHFKYGSIGSETKSGVPYWFWQALPRIFPEAFQGRLDYAAFGFLYETDEEGRQRDMPIGLSHRESRNVDLVWFNCSVCHVGTWRTDKAAPRHLVSTMPSNNLDLYRFIRFLLEAAPDARLAPDNLMAKMEEAGADFGPIERLVWRYYVIPNVREGLLQRRATLLPLLDMQPAWGPGRVDTFNPYKLVQFGIPAASLTAEERIGASDFPSVFHQRPRQGMQLHWDGNNNSLAERNLSAALGAGVTPETADHEAIERVADWLLDLPPPPSPARPDPGAIQRGREVYMQACAQCHGHKDADGYVFEGKMLGSVEPITQIQTDPARLNSYTEAFRQRQLSELFAGTPYHFRSFVKTDGYANMPLDGLWLRAPYLHNGSVPTLADLLSPPAERPVRFLRGLDVFDAARGGFVAPPCDPAVPTAEGFCLDTSLPGNGNGGHLYGTDLPQQAKSDLLAYLTTF